ncbi:methylenetetrahydrofolate reductase C-terminal domain-containing protein [bacterium]|nr:methylenetetrahydrofolate reductase C-terminal domain-containing protein [bacterium]
MSRIYNSSELVTPENERPNFLQRLLSVIMLFMENCIKIPLFRCQRCGECILSHTAFVCSQRCPKRLRNGPCGGVGEHGTCEVYPERKCIWDIIYRRAQLLGRLSLLLRVEKIHNWNLEKTSTWLNVFTKRIEPPVIRVRRKK